MMCEACERGDHDRCGMQTWCECECDGYHGFGLPDIELIPDDCLPQQHVIDDLLRGPIIGADGRIAGGTYDGMTPAEVLAARDAFNRACGL